MREGGERPTKIDRVIDADRGKAEKLLREVGREIEASEEALLQQKPKIDLASIYPWSRAKVSEAREFSGHADKLEDKQNIQGRVAKEKPIIE